MMKSGIRVKEIVPSLFVGEHSETSLIRKNIRHVILLNSNLDNLDNPDNLSSDVDPFDNVKYWSITIDQDIIPACEEVYKILQRNAQRRNILIHCCDTGKDKSVCVVAYFLKQSGKFETIDEAIDHIRQKRRPFGTKPSPIFIDQIKSALDEKDNDHEPDNTHNE